MSEQEKPTPETTKHPIGRPRLEFDLHQVEELGKIQSTQAEVAAVLGCGLSTVKDRLVNDPEFSAAYKTGLEAGKSSLRRLQWKSALAGNVVMQIWLGKQYLGQRDQQALEVSRAYDGNRLVELARTEKGRQVLAGLSEHLAKAMRALEEQAEAAIEAEATEMPALAAPEAESPPPSGR